MNLAQWSLHHQVFTSVLAGCALVGGLLSYGRMSRLEDPEFTIKTALVTTNYPGASAPEVEEEVTDAIEEAVQKMGQLDYIESTSVTGSSTLNVEIQKSYGKSELPQVWDELRRKVGDAQGTLPPGADPSLVIDDYGDVWGVYYALYGDEYTEQELLDVADYLRKRLVLVTDVAKVDIVSARTEVVYVEPDRDRMAQLGIPMSVIVQELREKNTVTDGGRVEVGPRFIAIEPTGTVQSVEDFEAILLTGAGTDDQITLGDVATVRRGYLEPASTLLRFDGHKAVGIAISTASGGNVITMGEAVDHELAALEGDIPLGMELGVIAHQAHAVEEAIHGFLHALRDAVLIVFGVLFLVMGWRSGVIVSFSMIVVICGTLIFMNMWGIALERISLGALIIALGMLADDPMVIIDGMLVRMTKGMKPEEAAVAAVGQTGFPLLLATIVVVLAFGAIGLSDDSTGEYCRSLFQVILISLLLSWVVSATTAPILGVYLLKVDPGATDPFGSPFYKRFMATLEMLLRRRWLTVGATFAAFAFSAWGFRHVDQSFFPDSTRPQFLLETWLPQGTHIDSTTARAAEVEKFVMGLEGVHHVATHVGKGAPRFILTYEPEKANTAYSIQLVEVEDYREIPKLRDEIEKHLSTHYADMLTYTTAFALGPGGGAKIEARLIGPDSDTLRQLSMQVEDIFRADPGTRAIRPDWRQRTPVVLPVVADQQANTAGVHRSDIGETLRAAFQGLSVGVYREGDDLLPIVVRAPERDRRDVHQIANLQIWSPAREGMIPLRQVVSRFETGFQDDKIVRRDRMRTLTVGADNKGESASRVLERVRPLVEALEYPPGYRVEWGGEYENSNDARAALIGPVPAFFTLMFLILVGLFNSVRKPVIIWTTVPLAVIGVTWGLLATSLPFGFMALLGFMSLAGIIIRNSVVLIEEMDHQTMHEGVDPWHAAIASSAHRLRPVSLGAITAGMGLIPLLWDVFFVGMAVTMMAGLVAATVLTMVIVPAMYVILFRAYPPKEVAS